MALVTWEVLEQTPDGKLHIAYDTSDKEAAERVFNELCANADIECMIHLVRCESVQEFRVAELTHGSVS